ncbi:MAG: leucine-rich repeat domain-containing protein [Nostoc sp.]|uniref:leucine-rich repeat domain-containing protein n=1 Tax=Nostoc sp. TaxID=1180 RepID=UPI002FF44DFC
MARDKAYQKAEQRIEKARQEGAIELNLSEMKLTEIPEVIASLTGLQTLFLSDNQLTELPEAIAFLTQLQSLNLNNNQLRELHALLKEKDPSFGGLVRVQNKRREFLWVHPQFVDEY